MVLLTFKLYLIKIIGRLCLLNTFDGFTIYEQSDTVTRFTIDMLYFYIVRYKSLKKKKNNNSYVLRVLGEGGWYIIIHITSFEYAH